VQNLPRFIQKFSTFRNNTKQLSVSVALPYLADNGRETALAVPAGGRTSADWMMMLSQCGQSNSDRYLNNLSRYPTQNRYLHIPPVVCCCHY